MISPKIDFFSFEVFVLGNIRATPASAQEAPQSTFCTPAYKNIPSRAPRSSFFAGFAKKIHRRTQPEPSLLGFAWGRRRMLLHAKGPRSVSQLPLSPAFSNPTTRARAIFSLLFLSPWSPLAAVLAPATVTSRRRPSAQLRLREKGLFFSHLLEVAALFLAPASPGVPCGRSSRGRGRGGPRGPRWGGALGPRVPRRGGPRVPRVPRLAPGRRPRAELAARARGLRVRGVRGRGRSSRLAPVACVSVAFAAEQIGRAHV